MSEVERFYPKLIGSITFLPDDDGEWVKASDYDAIANSGALVPVRIDPKPISHDGWFVTPTGLGWWGSDADGIPCVETPTCYYDYQDCYPVRLVPITVWEASDE